jgi:hypothetical protein
MYQVELPRVGSRDEAEKHLLTLQSERIVEDGKLRILVEALEYYARGGQDAGEMAVLALSVAEVKEIT